MGDNLLMNVCVVGGNAVSAFLSWRLQATNACDVTLVWKSGFDSVSQYGISFKYENHQNYIHCYGSNIILDLQRLAMSDSSHGMVRIYSRCT
jgi:hypothetical protein